MNEALNTIAAKLGVTFTDYQLEALLDVEHLTGWRRVCLYYKTGAGKSITALAMLAQWGYEDSVVVAPPSTFQSWLAYGEKLGMRLQMMSHAKFRMKSTKLSRNVPIVADEMHMFGGHGGQGWKKLDKLAMHLQAPVIMASATPNYNDADRVYCIQHILDPVGTKGGFLAFLYANCETEQNNFSMTPDVVGFKHHANAEEYLASLPGVYYLPDDLVYTINDVYYSTLLPMALDVFGYNERDHRVIASGMEDRHTRTFQKLVDHEGLLHAHVFELLLDIAGVATTPLMVYANHSTVAEAAGRSLAEARVKHAVITGDTTKKQKDHLLQKFRAGDLEVLVGTASLATGTDGMDKMCDWLVILDDTDDPSLRRQLIGRIMPRGLDTDASKKHVYRLLG